MVHTAVTCAPNTLTSQLKGDTAAMKPCPHQPTSTYSYTFAFVWCLFIIVKILVFPSPTGYMLTSFKFSLLVWGIFSRFFLNDWLFSWSIELQLVISQTQLVHLQLAINSSHSLARALKSWTSSSNHLLSTPPDFSTKVSITCCMINWQKHSKFVSPCPNTPWERGDYHLMSVPFVHPILKKKLDLL